MTESTVDHALDPLVAQLFKLSRKNDPYFCRFKGLFRSISIDLALAQLKGRTQGNYVFQRVPAKSKKSSKKNLSTKKLPPSQDHLRRQLVNEDIPHSICDSLLPVRTFLQRLFDRLGSLTLDTYTLGDMSLLVSFPGCQRQEWHTDYDHNSGSARRNFAVLLGLQCSQLDYCAYNADSILVQDKVSFRRGDLVIFRGDMVHAGSAYKSVNARVHFYIDSVTHPARSPNLASYVYFDPHVQASAHANALVARRKRRRDCLAQGPLACRSRAAAALPTDLAPEEGVVL
jgi:hypothetical protein